MQQRALGQIQTRAQPQDGISIHGTHSKSQVSYRDSPRCLFLIGGRLEAPTAVLYVHCIDALNTTELF